MSVATNNILKSLSDLSTAADKIVIESASEFMLPRISEWMSLVKNKLNSIVESVPESVEIPSLMPFLKGSNRSGPRVSTVLAENKKIHVHRKSKTRKSRLSSRKSSLRRKSNIKGTNETFSHHSEDITPQLKITPMAIKRSATVRSASSVEKKENTPALFTPVVGASKMMDKSSKRKSSSDLSLEKVKKPKMSNEELNDPKESEKSIKNAKVEKQQVKGKNSSLLPNYATIKSSIGANVVKESRVLRSKIETKLDKAVENRKNILALRQEKLQKMKRTREEKMEKTLQQRMKLEKDKLGKLRSGTQEKMKTNSNKEATPKAIYKTAAENETISETSNTIKSKEKEKQSSVKEKLVNLKKTGTSILRSNEKASIKKIPKHEIEKTMNVTYVAAGEQPSTSSKGNILKDANIGTTLGASKEASKDKAKTHTKVTKTVPKTVKPLIDSTSSKIPAEKGKKGPESYAITPARSSFVSYDVSEIRSDSEEEDQDSNVKPIPNWATGVRLRNALLQQHHHPLDTDELFGNFFEAPDLAVIMGIKKLKYNKRTSSAVWSSFT